MSNIKYLIVGQGIAGTLLAGELLKRGVSFKVVDNPNFSSASKVAAGVINPITGRKFVKTWMYEELEEVFLPSYRYFEKLLDGKYLYPRKIIRAIPSVGDQNNWDARSLSKEGQKYMTSNFDFSDFEGLVEEKLNYGMVTGYQLKIADLVKDFRTYLQGDDLVVTEIFDFDKFTIEDHFVNYGALQARHAIFCEGYKVINNPFFSHLPFSPAKGELLLVKIPQLDSKHLLKDQIFIAPQSENIYWVGATYGWDHFTDIPTQEKRAWLINALEKVLKVPYEIVDHQAGVRPATKYRRPLMGTHKDHKNLHLFNGLGTKGSSLGPYWSKHFIEYLEDSKELSSEVHI